MAISDIFNSITSGAGSIFMWVIIVIGIILLVMLLAGGAFLWWWNKKRYNLRVEIKMTRSDGKITLGEWGKGLYNSKKGVLFIKRAKMKSVPISMIDIRRYLQGNDLLTVLQVGPEDFRPVINDSWTEHIVEYVNEEGKVIEQKESILNIKADTGLNKPWKSAWETAAKKAYSITSFLQQFHTAIEIAIVLLACFVGFAIVWTRLPTVCR